MRYHTGDHVRIGDTDRARDAHVPAEDWQEERGGTVSGSVARTRVRHRRRAGGIAATTRGGTEAQQQLQGPNIVQGHGPRVNRRHGTAEFPVFLGHQRAHILRRVHIQKQYQQHFPSSQLHHHWNSSSELNDTITTLDSSRPEYTYIGGFHPVMCDSSRKNTCAVKSFFFR